MSILAAKEELASLTDFQRDIHITQNLSENIISNFFREFVKSTWYSSVPMKLKSTSDGDEMIYSINNSFHFLIYSYMRFMLPSVRVNAKHKGRVRIAWCHNIGTNIVSQAVFKEDDDAYHTWDNVWADIYFQFFQSEGAGKRESHNVGIGNVECLENFSEYLPSYPINVDQPWFYSMDNALAFPIFYKNSQTRAEHRYTFRRKIVDLLRVEILTREGKWKPTTRKVHQYLDINASATLKIPELWGRYAYISEKEIAWYKCKPQRTFYIRDVEVCETSNPNKYKSTAEISLQCTNPCLAFFWVAENLDASLNHNYSNYTTNTSSLYEGWDPIRTTTLKYGTTTRLDNMPSDHFSIAESRKHFRSSPDVRGYHGYSFAGNSDNFHGDIGIVLGNMNAKLHCRIANNNIFTNLSYEEDEDEDDEDDDIVDLPSSSSNQDELKLDDITPEEISPNFMTRSRLLVLRKFQIIKENDVKDIYKFIVN